MSPPAPIEPRRRSGRRWGQCFLRDIGIIRRIVRSMDISPGQRVLEIGPGRGALTGPLLEQVSVLHAVEKDTDLAVFLRQSYPDRLVIHNECALRFDYRRWSAGQPWRIVGNLPYSISTPLLFCLFGQAGLTDMTFMMQKEVVNRLRAPVDTSSYGRLSVMVRCRWQVERLFVVAPGAFSPMPGVHSAVARLHPLSVPLLTDEELPQLDQVVRRAFSGRRKLLSTALAGMASSSDLAAAGIEPKQRAAELSPEQYVRLSRAIASTATEHE